MYFLDKSGHIFYEQQYKEYPIGTEYNEHENIFWITSNEQYNLSINNYYGRTINILIPLDVKYRYWYYNGINTNIIVSSYDDNPVPNHHVNESTGKDMWYFNDVEIGEFINEDIVPEAIDVSTFDDLEIEISCNSNIFHLIPAYKFENIQELNFNRLNITDELNNGKQILSSKNDNGEKYDILALFIHDENINNVNKYFALVPVYIFSYATDPSTWITNLIIHIKNNEHEEWGTISVGAKYVEENEILDINLNNLGIKIPKDILHAVYDSPFMNNSFDDNLWNKKLKEYLINYMEIHVESGNFNSAIKSLRWFGYGDKLTISKLFKTDNDLKTQYVRDYFDISNDLLSSFDNFQQKAIISLTMLANEELKDEEGNFIKVEQDFSDDFYGEEKPVMIDLFKSFRTKDIGLGYTEKWKYIAPFYKYSFNEMGLKLACLKKHYKEEFLPLHMNVNSSSIQTRTYMDDIKFSCYPSVYINEGNVSIDDKDFDVEIKSDNNIYWFNEQIHKVDRFLNEYCTTLTDTMQNSENDLILYIHDTCANIPIKFKTPNKLYNCVFILEEVNQNNEFELFCNVEIPINSSIKLISNNKIYNQTYHISYKEENGEWSEWFDDIFDIHSIFEERYGDENRTYQVKFLLKDMSVDKIVIYDNEELRKTINKDYVYNITIDIENVYLLKLSPDHYVDDLSYKYIYKDKIIYESKFSFINNKYASTYQNFVLYPRLLNDNDSTLDYWIDHKFRLRMNINDHWYTHEFICKIDELHIKYGVLKYKYWSNNENWYSDFKQFRYIYGNKLDEYKFNSFMYEPELVTINNSNFINDLVQYYKLQNHRYINGQLIPFNEFFYQLDVNVYGVNYKLKIHNNMIGKPIYLILDIDTKEILEFTEEYNGGFDVTFILCEEGKNNETTYEYHTGKVLEDTLDREYFIFDNNEDEFFDKHGFILLNWYEDLHMYGTGIPEDDQGTGMIYIPVKQTYNTLNRNNIFNNITRQNISFGDNYLNSVFVFDLYEENKEKINIWNFKHFINTNVKGIKISNVPKTSYDINNDMDSSNVFHFSFSKSIKDKYYNNGKISIQDFLQQYKRDTEIIINTNDDIETQINSITTRELELLTIWWNDFSNYNYISNDPTNKINFDYSIETKTKYLLYEYDNILYKYYTKNVFAINEHISKIELHPIKFEDNNENFILDITPSTDNKIITFVNGIINVDQDLLCASILEYSQAHNVSISKKELNRMDLQYIYLDNRGTEIHTDIKVKFLYLDNEGNDKEFSFNEYMNIRRYIIEEKIKIYAQLFYTVEYKEYGIKHEFDTKEKLSKFLHEKFYNDVDDISIIDKKEFHDHIFDYDENTHKFFAIDDNINYGNINEIKQLIDSINIYKIEYDEVINKFGDVVDDLGVKQYYWLETKPKISNVDSLDQLIDFSDLYINWNEQTDINEVANILSKSLDSPNEDRSIKKDYYEYLINQYYYENIFAIDLTHISGKYEIEYMSLDTSGRIDTSINSCIKLCAVILHDDDSISIFNKSNDVFTVLPSDKLAKVFIQCEICPNDDVNNTEYWNRIEQLMKGGVDMVLKLYKHSDQKYSKIKYNISSTPEDSKIKLQFNDSTYYISDNQNEINDMYLRFFTPYKKVELPDSIYRAGIKLSHFYKQNVSISDMFLKYDVYLMHDFEHWYAIFISQDTIDRIDTRERLYVKDYHDIVVPKINEDDPEILLKFVKHGTLPLINRLYCEWNENNVFNKEDIIVANIQNNKKLQINPVISSKWNISNMSIGSTMNTTFVSNNEMCIITTSNDTLHYPGYYNVDVHYTLTNLSNHQFKAESRMKILK